MQVQLSSLSLWCTLRVCFAEKDMLYEMERFLEDLSGCTELFKPPYCLKHSEFDIPTLLEAQTLLKRESMPSTEI